jgi:chlorite dismutase
VTRLTTFSGGDFGNWEVESIEAVAGASLPDASWLAVSEDAEAAHVGAAWLLRGVTSNQRYTTREEQTILLAEQPQLGRPEATRAALIPIRKTEEWWELAQDERREILADRSKHVSIGLEYLPGVARRLYHCRDFGEPFDFLTWFEYAPAQAAAFSELVARLRDTPEWGYVEREVEIRLVRGSREVQAHSSTR